MNKRNRIPAYILLLSLFILGLFKDLITPDYHNSPVACFLNPQHKEYIGVFKSHLSLPVFWIKAYLYTIAYTIIPYFIIKLLYSKQYARYTLCLLSVLVIAEYSLVWIENVALNLHILPKINRYLHSPFITLFLIAALTLYNHADTEHT
jgi:hypothetical protein